MYTLYTLELCYFCYLKFAFCLWISIPGREKGEEGVEKKLR